MAILWPLPLTKSVTAMMDWSRDATMTMTTTLWLISQSMWQRLQLECHFDLVSHPLHPHAYSIPIGQRHKR
jgi:hypothetical protein